MKLSEIRAKAREILTGKWGKVALIMLIQMAIVYGAELISNFMGGILSIGITICSIPIEYGLYISFMKIRKNEEVGYVDFLKDGFKNFGRSWGVVGNILLKIWPWLVAYVLSVFVLIIGIVMAIAGGEEDVIAIMILGIFICMIAGIILVGSLIWMTIRGLLYSLANYISIDRPEMTTKQAVQESENLMRGNRVKFFLLGLTFIGWEILAVCTFGIGFLWLTPYIAMSEIAFYEMLKGKSNNNVEVIEENK